MYIWNVNALVEDLSNAKIDQKEQVKYVLTYSLLGLLMADPVIYKDLEYSVWTFCRSITMVVLVILGVLYCYNINKRGDDKDFILRFACLSIPIFFRISAFVLVIVIILGSIQGIFQVGLAGGIHEVIITIIYIVLYYLYLSSKMKIVSHKAMAENRD
jgi:hypothetical protein